MRDNFDTARTYRYTIARLLTGRTVRTAADAAAITACVTAGALSTITGSTFALFSGTAADDSCSITSGLKVLTSPNNPWAATDVGKPIDVAGAGAAGAVLSTRIAAYTSAGSITLRDAAGTTVAATKTSAGGLAGWGDDLGTSTVTPTNANEAGTRELAVTRITANDSTTGRSLSDRFSTVFNILDFGAVAGDTGNQATAINAAIAALTVVGGGTLLIPAGTFRITASITLDQANSNISIRGVGRGVSKIHVIGAIDGIKCVDSVAGAPGVQQVTIADLTVYGDGTAAAMGVHFDYCYHSQIVRVEATGFSGAGSCGIKIERGFYNTVEDCWANTNAIGILLGRIANANTIRGGHYERNTLYGIRIDSEADATRQHANTVIGATLESNGTYNLSIWDSDDNRCFGLYMESGGADTTTAQVHISAPGGSTAAYNVIEACNFAGAYLSVSLDRCTDTKVCGCSINYGITTIVTATVRARFVDNTRLAGAVTDGSLTTTIHADIMDANMWYTKNGATSRFGQRVYNDSTVDYHAAGYRKLSFTDLDDAFRFEVCDVAGTPFAVMRFGAWRFWVFGGTAYVKGGTPANGTDGTVVGP